MKEQIFKVVVRYEPVGDESETAVAELEGREAADGALGATDELKTAESILKTVRFVLRHHCSMSMSAQQYGPQRHWDHDLQTSYNTPILCSAGIRVKMRASISGFSPSHIAFSFSAAPFSSSFFFWLKHILLGLMVMVPFCLLHATTIGSRVEWNTALFGLQSFVHAHLLPYLHGSHTHGNTPTTHKYGRPTLQWKEERSLIK